MLKMMGKAQMKQNNADGKDWANPQEDGLLRKAHPSLGGRTETATSDVFAHKAKLAWGL